MPIVSIFTPTHRPDWLLDTYRSLQEQTCPDWEWIIVPNCGQDPYDAEKVPVLPGEITADLRVRCVPCQEQRTIGGYKKFACQQATTQLLVELDHDDLLAPDAVATIYRAAETASYDVGLFYSDFVLFFNTGTSRTFGTVGGWSHYKMRFRDQEYDAVQAFEPTVASLASIRTAPNHVRVWRKAAYDAVGGHDERLTICDDYELICRTRAAGWGFAHIDAPLYLYREHGLDNTYQHYLEEIGRQSNVIANKYIYELIRLEALQAGRGAWTVGPLPHEGYQTIWEGGAVDRRHNVRRSGLPFDDDSVGVLRAHDVLQFFSPAEALEFFNEAYRVLVPHGWLLLRVPSTEGPGAWACPLNRSYWNRQSWKYFTEPKLSESIPGLTVKFCPTRLWEGQDGPIHYTFADLVAVKGPRVPGYRG